MNGINVSDWLGEIDNALTSVAKAFGYSASLLTFAVLGVSFVCFAYILISKSYKYAKKD